MLIQAAMDLELHVSMLDPDPAAPCATLAATFTAGSLTDYATVYGWRQQQDLLTIESSMSIAPPSHSSPGKGNASFPSQR